ncbi:MAG: MFS transporter [Planctomycetes bacterium]|nr:MFS transporter [Planctomycetota bacterium]
MPGADGAPAVAMPVPIPPGVVPAAVYRKAVWRLIPLLFILYIASFLDRVNLNHAEIPFSKDLGLDKSQYGFGAGLFFVGYLLSQVPSNMILVRMGPRRWIACIMVTWGLISGAMAFATDKNSFYCLRFLLGFAEAGFFPGMLLYLSYWFPSTMRAQMVGRFMTAIAVAQVVGSSLSSQLMKLDGVAGLHGWQWLFLIEALPSILLTVVVLKAMVNRPSEASWLNRDEAAWLDAELTADRARVAAVGRSDLRAAFTEPRVYLLMAVYLADCLANYGTTFSITSLIQNSGNFDQITAIWLTAIPYSAATVAMIVVGWNSDRTRSPRAHVAIPYLVGAAAFLSATFCMTQPVPFIICASIGVAAVYCALGPFWALPATFLAGPASAAGIAVINSVGNLGGFLGTFLKGSFTPTIWFQIAAGFLIVGAIVTMSLRLPRQGGDR